MLARINQRLSALKPISGSPATLQPISRELRRVWSGTQPADNSLGTAFNNSGEVVGYPSLRATLKGRADQQRIALQRQRRIRRGEVLEPVALFGQVPQWWGGYEGSLIRGMQCDR